MAKAAAPVTEAKVAAIARDGQNVHREELNISIGSVLLHLAKKYFPDTWDYESHIIAKSPLDNKPEFKDADISRRTDALIKSFNKFLSELKEKIKTTPAKLSGYRINIDDITQIEGYVNGVLSQDEPNDEFHKFNVRGKIYYISSKQVLALVSAALLNDLGTQEYVGQYIPQSIPARAAGPADPAISIATSSSREQDLIDRAMPLLKELLEQSKYPPCGTGKRDRITSVLSGVILIEGKPFTMVYDVNVYLMNATRNYFVENLERLPVNQYFELYKLWFTNHNEFIKKFNEYTKVDCKENLIKYLSDSLQSVGLDPAAYVHTIKGTIDTLESIHNPFKDNTIEAFAELQDDNNTERNKSIDIAKVLLQSCISLQDANFLLIQMFIEIEKLYQKAKDIVNTAYIGVEEKNLHDYAAGCMAHIKEFHTKLKSLEPPESKTH